MFAKLYKNSSVKEILVFSLSNLGDVILTCPVIDVLLRDFPEARVSVIVAPKGDTLFISHPRITTIVYDKHAPFTAKRQWLAALRKTHFDVLIDLRQTALGLLVPCRWCTPFFPVPFDGHLELKHLARLKAVYPEASPVKERLAIIPKPTAAVDGLSGYVVLAPGAADSAKRWGPSGFVAVADFLAAQGRQVMFVGGPAEEELVKKIRAEMKHPSLSVVSKTDLRELAFVLTKARFAVTHDSGAMHLASYFGVPVVALFGPTDPYFSRPWSSGSKVVHPNTDCPRCARPKDHGIKHTCMGAITVEDVIDAVRDM